MRSRGTAGRLVRARRPFVAVAVLVSAALLVPVGAFSQDAAPALPAGAVLRLGTPEHATLLPASALPLPGIQVLAVSPDGTRIATSGEPGESDRERTVVLWDAATGRPTSSFAVPSAPVRMLEFSPDGTKLAVMVVPLDDEHPQGLEIREAATGKLVQRLPGGSGPGRYLDEGGRIVEPGRAGANDVLRTYDPATGQEVQRFVVEVAWRAVVSGDGRTRVVVKTVSPSDTAVRVIDVAKNAQRYRLDDAKQKPTALDIAPDGRTAAASDGSEALLWELATGRLVHRLKGHAGRVLRIVFSPDGRFVATSSSDKSVRLWEVATGQELHRFAGHDGIAAAIAFLPESRGLVTGSLDRTALVWSLKDVPRTKLPTGAPAETELAELWQQLGSGDAGAAYRALGRIAVARETAMPFLRSQIDALLVPVQQERILKLIRELDDDDYVVRHRAMIALAKLKEVARPTLLKVVTQTASAEVQARIRRILAGSGNSPRFSASDIRRMLRTIHAAEQNGGPDADAVLDRIAKDFPADEVIGEAKRAQERLARKKGR